MTMKTVINMPRYSVYKDSGVDWLGKIPNHWSIVPTKRKHKIIKQINKHGFCDNVLSLTLRGVVNNDILNPEGLVPSDYASYQFFQKNDLVFKLIDLENLNTSRVGLVHEDGIMSPAYIRLQIGNSFFPRYAYYYFYFLYLNGVYNNLGRGVRSTLCPSDLLNMPILEPSKDEQILIANHLDKKIIEIDQAILVNEKQVELLKERQQIIIQQAVTKGLDPNVPMKDSGIEWIGMIPEHWEIKKLKYVLQLTNKKQLSLNSELLYIGMENIESGTGEFIETNSETEGLANYFEANQLLFGKLRPYLAKVYKTRTIGLCSTEFLVYKCPDNLCIDFYHCFLISPEFIKVINASTYGSKMPRANSDFIGNQMILVPPLKEQIEINQYVNKNKNNIKQLIIIYQQQIEKLKEYKTTLIDSAVTGKIKITSEE